MKEGRMERVQVKGTEVDFITFVFNLVVEGDSLLETLTLLLFPS